MNGVKTARWALCVGAAAAFLLSASALPGQSRWTAPRTPWGEPDLQGTWPGTAMMGVPIEQPRESAAPRPAGRGAGIGPPGHWGERGEPQRQTSLVVDPPDGRIPPMTPEGVRRTAAVPRTWYYDNDGGGPFNAPADLSVYDRCITRGVIGSMLPVGYNAGNQIVQAPGLVALRNEMIHETRIIPTDGRSHLSPVMRQYMGHSVGRWDGDTLVVETTNLTSKTGAGANGRAIFHSEAATLTERFTRTNDDTLHYTLTIDDPVMWTRPWTLSFPLTRDPGYGMFEYACHEGNYGLRNILSAARADERREP